MAKTVLVTGASGFIGSHLTTALVDKGYQVRAMTRHPESYHGDGDVVYGDVADAESLKTALDGVDAAYYLVHSLDSNDFEDKDADAALNFAEARPTPPASNGSSISAGSASTTASCRPICVRAVRSRSCCTRAGVPVTALRAAVVIGNGGISWEITRQLVDHLPVMVTPQLGQHPHPADRPGRRHPLPRRGPRTRGGEGAGVRDRRA